MAHRIFKAWLQGLTINPTATGDLIHHLKNDPDLPENIASLESLTSYLRRAQAPPEALDAAPNIWRRYQMHRSYTPEDRPCAVEQRRTARAAGMARPVPLLADRHILVVEDEHLVAHDLARALQAQGAVVLGPVATVADALAIIGAGTGLDAVLLDLNLQGEMAFPVADRLQACGVPFAFVTGYGPDIIPLRHADVPRHEKPAAAATIAAALSA